MKNIKEILLFTGLLGTIVLAFLFGVKGFTLFNLGNTPNKTKMSDSYGLIKEAYAVAGSEEKFEYLSKQSSSYCSLQPVSIDSYSDEDRIQGACCSAMDLHRYQEQVEGLKKYSEYDVVPEDPYDISADLAQRLFDYQKNIQLNDEQQEVYSQAEEHSHEGGPCCCKCWRWYAFEGQAKYLITEHGFTADQIAELWDFQDGCGGSGHEHG